MRPINALELYSRIAGEWDKTSQPLTRRGIPGSEDLTNQGLLGMFSLPALANALAPVGTYEDGSTGLAWPQLLAAPAEGMVNFGRYGYDTPEAIADNARSAFDVAGGAVTGGLGLGLAGGLADNAVGSAGGNLARGASNLPMDLASRMARAREMGFDTDRVLYHGGNGPWQGDGFIPSRDGNLGPGVYASQSPYVAGQYAQRVSDSGDLFDGGHVTPFFARGKLASYADYVDAAEAAKSRGVDMFSQFDEAEKFLREAGYSGVVGDDAGRVVNIFDPRNIRSVNAAFDPSKSDSANLLAANAKTGAAVPLATNALERQPQGIRAYHGSPHDFDRFSLDKIGTGEGAQAYGHGLYFADSEDVARSYRDALSGPKGGINLGAVPISSEAGKLAFMSSGGDIDKAIASVEGIVRGGGKNAEMYQGVLDELIANRDGIATAAKNPGRMYEVNIRANPEDFLDWDKPVTPEIADRMAEAFTGLMGSHYDELADLLRYGHEQGMTGREAHQWIANTLEKGYVPDGVFRDVSGKYADHASQYLREAGIPGIRYLDGMSRDGGTGTSNYVVFDDQLIDILRKYANAPTAAALPLAAETQDQDPALLEYLRAVGLY